MPPVARLVHEQRASGRIAVVTLDDEARLNALGPALMTEFTAAMAGASDDPALRAVVVTGAGTRAFAAGADLDVLEQIADPQAARAFILEVHGCCAAIRACPVPVIARINGLALGAGLELAAACDIRLAADHARLGMPEVRVGVPSVVEAALLPGLIGWGRARRLLLTGETVDAVEALAMGLIDAIAPAEGLDALVERDLAAILASDPAAVRAQKRLIRTWEALSLDQAIEAGVDAFAEAYATDVPARAIAAWRVDRLSKTP
jgi:enoyl-CoA hydratase/carnithine racemase